MIKVIYAITNTRGLKENITDQKIEVLKGAKRDLSAVNIFYNENKKEGHFTPPPFMIRVRIFFIILYDHEVLSIFA